MAVPGTFISGTGPIGRGSGEKRAGNLNFAGGATIEIAVWVYILAVSGDQVLPGVTRCCQVWPDVAWSDQMLPGVTRYSVLVWQERWRSGNGKKSVLA